MRKMHPRDWPVGESWGIILINDCCDGANPLYLVPPQEGDPQWDK